MGSCSLTRFMESKMGTFARFVMFVFLEWMLIALLFVDGILAFLSNQFAKYFDLRIPCLLCTRIDHVFVHRNIDFYYNDSICESHKKNISRMAYCHVHKKLSDIRSMCEGCLLSFATEKEADCDTYKSLVGILNKDLECFVEDDSKIHLKFPNVRREEDIIEVEKYSPQHFCSCCGDQLKMKLTFPKGNSNAVSNKTKQLSVVPTPSPRAPPYLLSKIDDSRNLDLPHIPYTELKSSKGSQSPLEEETSSNTLNSDAKVPLLTDSERLNEEAWTPVFKYFGVPQSDSPTASPRWSTRVFRKSPLLKTEYATESGGGNANAANYEIDGESILHRLKRQVRLDRKSLIDLYMELDEERSASTEAANNAMTMITRLQAEKAAVQMEALQYQRMMEEQAEYDQEAIQVMKELLDKREDEVKALESELEVYREKLGVIDLSLRDINEYDDGAEAGDENDYQELKSHSTYSERSESVQNSPLSVKENNSTEPFRLHDFDLENERV